MRLTLRGARINKRVATLKESLNAIDSWEKASLDRVDGATTCSEIVAGKTFTYETYTVTDEKGRVISRLRGVFLPSNSDSVMVLAGEINAAHYNMQSTEEFLHAIKRIL